ncbi:MAG: sigma 54-interacting transcriptional regulator [bacterium]|nr:sigma 54-interacting transcriptional regulator [bacterium]
MKTTEPILVSWIGDTELLVLGKIGRYNDSRNLVQVILNQDKQGSHYDVNKEISNLDITVRNSSILLLLDKETRRIGNIPDSFSKLILLANRPEIPEIFQKFREAFTRLIADEYPEYESKVDIRFVSSANSAIKGVDPWDGKEVHDQVANILNDFPEEEQKRFCYNLTPGTITQSTVLPIYGLEHAANPSFLQVSKADRSIRKFEVPFDTLSRNDANARALEESNAPSQNTITGDSPAILRTTKQAQRLAPSPYNIILHGESGTGKELFARLIHATSGRKGKFIAHNCATLKGQIGESNMTGYPKGAFTDAKVAVKGWLSEANNGTLFLDEIEVCPPSAQETLLRILQPLRGESVTTRHYFQYGSDKEETADVRIIVATNKDLKGMVRDGDFREDLYYRLSTFTLEIPSLEERKKDGHDIALLATEFLANFNRDCSQTKSFTPDALDALSNLSWKGNVRQLQNAVISVAFLSENNTITADDIRQFLPDQIAQHASTQSAADSLDILIRGGTFDYHAWEKSTQRAIAQKAVAIFPQKTRAAKALNISYSVLCKWLST